MDDAHPLPTLAPQIGASAVLWMDHPLRHLLGPVIAAGAYVLLARRAQRQG